LLCLRSSPFGKEREEARDPAVEDWDLIIFKVIANIRKKLKKIFLKT
jgi:hypothetical protein